MGRDVNRLYLTQVTTSAKVTSVKLQAISVLLNMRRHECAKPGGLHLAVITAQAGLKGELGYIVNLYTY